MSKLSQAKSTTWIDLTDMVSWRGHFTGIQRVVDAYASRFAKDGARFFIYDGFDDRHVEVAFNFQQLLIEQESKEQPLTKRKKMRLLIGKPYYALPDRQKAYLRPVVGATNTLVRTTLARTIDRQRNIPRSVFYGYPDAEFLQGDIVVVIGAGWNAPGSIERLAALRKEKQFRLIQHINDILPIYQPHLFADELPKAFTPYIETVVKNADVMTVISEATKRDVEIFCSQQDVKRPKINVVRLGEDIGASASKRPESFTGKEFVLSVGTFEIRKNYILLYQAAKLAELEGRAFPCIVIAGRKGWLTEDLAHVIKKDPFTRDKILWLNGVSDSEMNWLYGHSLFTVFPSLCEGWGLPIVESLQHGKVCLTSNVSSMLEIGKGIVDYFSPYDVRSCMEKIIEYADQLVYEAANKRVRENYRIFTWDDSYAEFKVAVTDGMYIDR